MIAIDSKKLLLDHPTFYMLKFNDVLSDVGLSSRCLDDGQTSLNNERSFFSCGGDASLGECE